MTDAELMRSLSHSARREYEQAAARVRQRDDLTKRQKREALRREAEMIAAMDAEREARHAAYAAEPLPAQPRLTRWAEQ